MDNCEGYSHFGLTVGILLIINIKTVSNNKNLKNPGEA